MFTTLECSTVESVCETDGIVVQTISESHDTASDRWIYQMEASFEPGSGVQLVQNISPTTYEVHVEAGRIGLTASAPVDCSGSCTLTAGDQGSVSRGPETTRISVPPGTEVILGPGDTAIFEEDQLEATHTYRNAGPDPARLRSTVSSPTPDEECKGRCFTTV
jgi:hypothetical protein